MRVHAFYLFGFLTLVFGLLAITRRNPVHSALMLVLSLLSGAGIYLVLGAKFLAMAQIFVYAGAIVVLFVFVIMMVGTGPEVLARRARHDWGWGLGAALLVGAALALKLPLLPGAVITIVETSPRALAAVLVGSGGLLGEHALAFELGSFLVLASMIGAVMLGRMKP